MWPPLGKPQKNNGFLLVDRPSSLVATKFCQEFFLELQKTVFFLSGQALTSSPLSGRVLKKRPLFLAASLAVCLRSLDTFYIVTYYINE